MQQLGIMTYALDASQQGIMLTQSLNHLVDDYNVDPIVFYREFYQSIITPKFAIMQEVEIWTFNHPIISTNIDTTQRLIKSPCATKKFFYVMNLEWLYMSNISYDQLWKIYAHNDIELIARSKSHYKLLHMCWKKPLCIIEDFNHHQIMDVIK